MDWTFTEEQDELAALVRSILERELTEERRRALDATQDRFDRDLYRLLSEAGVLTGLGPLELCRVFVELGRAVAAVPVAPAVVATFLPGRSDLVTAALAGDPADAELTDLGWVLSGTKTTVPAGSYADAFCVPVDDRVFIVTRGAEGLSIERQMVTDTSSEAMLALDRTPGESVEIDPHDLERYLTLAICAHQLGVCERALELTAEYSKQRVQFDRPIATFQAVGQRLADAYIDVHGIRLTLWQAAWRLAEALPCDDEIATAKFWASDAGHRVAHTAVHVHGGVGIDLDYHLHRYFTAAKRNEFALGAATEQLVRLGRSLAEDPA